MNILLRSGGLLALLIPFFSACLILTSLTLTGCMNMELAEAPEEADAGEFERLIDGILEAHEDTDVGVGAEADADVDIEVEEFGADEDVEYRIVDRTEFEDLGDLQFDPNAPDLEILTVNRREGDGRHVVDVVCHDGTRGLPNRWFGGGRRVSRTCEIDLSTVFRSLRIEPEMNYRIAPTSTGFRVLGDFTQGEATLRFRPGLRTERGAVLKEEQSREVTIPPLSASLSFEARGRYLPRWAWEELAFEHRNVEGVALEIRHIPPRNLPFWLSDNNENVTARTSRRLFQEDLALPAETDRVYRRSLSVDEILGDPEPGLYQFHLQDSENRRTTATARLLITEMNLIAKRHEAPAGQPWESYIDGWAIDMTTNRPLTGVTLEVIRASGEVMAQCRTDRQGHCRLELPEDTTDDAPPVALLAKRPGDMTYLRFRDVRTESGTANTTGRPYLTAEPYLATIYGDRDLYRPGDRVYLLGALRDPDFTSAGAGVPVKLEVRDSRGQVVSERTLSTDSTGLVQLSVPVSENAPTGRWRAMLSVGTNTLHTYSFLVEEFIPERLEASARPTTPHFVGDAERTFEVSARYLFGASAQGSPVEATCRLVPTTINTPWARGFAVGPGEHEERRQVVDLPQTRAIIGEEDTAEIRCGTSDSPLVGPARVEATFAVSEAGSGRATHASASALVYPEPYLVGLRSSSAQIAGGDAITIEGRIFDLDGERVDIEQEVTLEFYNIRHQWSSQWIGNRWSYQVNTQLIMERAIDVEPVDGRFRVETVAADVSSGYLVRARMGNLVTDLQLRRSGRYWSWSSSRDVTPRALRPTPVTVEVPAEAKLGEPTEVVFDLPFAGRALLTVETDQVIRQAWIDADAGKNTWRFTLDDHVPNVYVSAFVIRDGRVDAGGGFAPERAYGTAPLRVERTPVEAPLRLEVPQEIRPGSSFDVEVIAGTSGRPAGPGRVTVAVVDEGILQLTNYRTPNPLDVFLARRGLGVHTYDTVGWATQLPATGPSSVTGGGDYYDEDGGESASRIMPFRPVALWSGPVELDANGRARVSFDVPNYRGRLRVMATAFTEDRMGSADADVLVRDPLTVDATFPRFLLGGDRAEVPVFLANLTGALQEVEITISATPFEIPGFDVGLTSDAPVVEFPEGTTRAVTLEADGTASLTIPVRALVSNGAAELRVVARAGEHRSVDEGMVPLRPEGPRERRVTTVALNGSSVDLTDALAGWVTGSEESTIWLSSIAHPEGFDHLDYLIRYPFGCLEQVTSAARPLLFVSELVEAISPAQVARAGRVDDMISSGIQRLIAMQAPSGHFSYWSGGGHYNNWLTAYALHFLLDADEQGHEVPPTRVQNAVNALKQGVSGTPSDAYAHYVLARAGEANRGQIAAAIDRLPETRRGQQQEQAYLLYGALYLSGDRSYEEELRNPQVDPDTGGRTSGWGFYSHDRSRAMVLNVFVDLFGPAESGHALANQVAERLASRHRFNTQEVVWSVTGLGKWIQGERTSDATFQLYASGQELAPGRHVRGLPAWTIQRAADRELRMTTDYAGDRPIYAVVSSSGVRERPEYRFGGEGLQVERTYLDASGRPLNLSDVDLGQRVYVRVRITNNSGRAVQQVSLMDRLPAGLEPEMTALGAGELPAFASTTWNFDHQDHRDDRVDVFGTIPRGHTVEIHHAARATLSGTFRIPTVEVEAMYETEIWAREKGGVLTVTDPRTRL